MKSRFQLGSGSHQQNIGRSFRVRSGPVHNRVALEAAEIKPKSPLHHFFTLAAIFTPLLPPPPRVFEAKRGGALS